MDQFCFIYLSKNVEHVIFLLFLKAKNTERDHIVLFHHSSKTYVLEVNKKNKYQWFKVKNLDRNDVMLQ